MNNKQARAKAGGEIGANGEWYEGGKFIATTDKSKMPAKPKKVSKQEIAPYKWEVAPTADHRAIYSFVGGVWAKYNRDTGKMSVSQADTPDNILEIIEAFNNGVIWAVYNHETRRVENETTI